MLFLKLFEKHIFVLFYISSFVTAIICPMVWHLKSNKCSQWSHRYAVENSSEYKTNSETQKVNRLSYVKYWTWRNWLYYYM